MFGGVRVFGGCGSVEAFGGCGGVWEIVWVFRACGSF